MSADAAAVAAMNPQLQPPNHVPLVAPQTMSAVAAAAAAAVAAMNPQLQPPNPAPFVAPQTMSADAAAAAALQALTTQLQLATAPVATLATLAALLPYPALKDAFPTVAQDLVGQVS